MSKLKILWRILKRIKAFFIVGLFIVFLLLCALIILFTEPTITNYGDALWYCYVVTFTIGFGDFAATSLIGRIVSVLISIYSAVVIAIITGVIVLFYQEIVKIGYKQSKEEVIDKLTHLDKLPNKELKEISDRIKKITD